MGEVLSAFVKELADLGWRGFQAVNRRVPETPHEGTVGAGTTPPAGWPRNTHSLCPRCAIENGEAHPATTAAGAIAATIAEEDGRLVIRKTCRVHGSFEDVLSIDPEFTHRVEGRDVGHEPGAARGARTGSDALTVNLAACAGLDEVRARLDASVAETQRAPWATRTVRFTGREPAALPYFLEACRYACEVGYVSVRAVTSGARFALEAGFALEARAAGLDLVYLEFDGTARFGAAQRAVDVLHAAGIDVVPVTTIVNTVNSDRVGPIVDFVIRNCDKIGGAALQPVSFTGAEAISDDDRRRRRYTLAHLAHELARHSHGKIDPYRDWFPLGAVGAFRALVAPLGARHGSKTASVPALDGVSGPCHASCGASVVLVAHRRTKAWSAITEFFDIERCIRDLAVIRDSARGRELTLAQVALCVARNFDAARAPRSLRAPLLRLFQRGAFCGSRSQAHHEDDDWTVLFVGGMWRQDLWTYDFRLPS